MSLLAALKLAGRGFRVFPLARDKKIPAVEGWQASATDDELALIDTWPVGHNPGIVTDGFVVLDGDMNKDGVAALLQMFDGKLPDTYTVRTVSDGLHLYFRAPAGMEFATRACQVKKDGTQVYAIVGYWGVDVRAKGGLVVGAGAHFPDGLLKDDGTRVCVDGRYSVENDAPVIELPSYIAELLKLAPERKAGEVETVTVLDNPYALQKAREYLTNEADLAVEGCGGDPTTIRVANRVFDFGASIETAVELMAECWNDRCSPPWDVDRLAYKVNSAAKSRQDPIGRDDVSRVFEPVEPAPPEHKTQLNGDTLITTRASDIQPKNVEWIWRDRIPRGKVSLLAGDQALGKTTVLLDTIARITRGALWPCGEGQAPLGSVIYLGTEDDPADTLVPRLMACGADLSRVHFLTAVTTADGKGQRSFNLATDLAKLESKIKELGDVISGVVDPINSYFGHKADTYKTGDVRTVLEPLAEMASRLRVAIIGNTHLTKDGKGRDPNKRILDSQAITAVARGITIVAPDPENPERVLFMRSKGSNAKRGLPALAYTLKEKTIGQDPSGEPIIGSYPEWAIGKVALTADEVFGRLEDKSRPTPKRDRATAFLLMLLGDGPKPSLEVSAAAQAHVISGSTLQDAKDALGIVVEKTGMAGGWIWRLPTVENF